MAKRKQLGDYSHPESGAIAGYIPKLSSELPPTTVSATEIHTQQLSLLTKMVLDIKKRQLIDLNKRQVSSLDIPIKDHKLFNIMYVCLLPASATFAWEYLWGTTNTPVFDLLVVGGTIHIISKVIPVWFIKVKNLLKPLWHNSKDKIYDYLANRDSIKEKVITNQIEELSNDVN